MSEASHFSAKLAVFQAALIDLLSRADHLGVTAEDRAVILALLLSIAEQSFSQALSSTFFAFENRRLLALTSLGLQKSAERVAVKTLPLEGPHLFAGHFLEAVDSEISMHKRASDLAAKLKPTPAFPPFVLPRVAPFGAPVLGDPVVPGVALDAPLSVESASLPLRLQEEALPVSPSPPPPPHLPMTIQSPSLTRIGAPWAAVLSLFLSQWRCITDDAFVLSVVAHGYIISPSQDFPGVLRLKTVTPGNLLAQAKIEDEIASLLQKRAHRQSRRSSSSFVVPDFRSSEKVRRPSRYFEPKKDQCFLPAATFPDGISSGSAAPAPKTGLGSL